jgi:hypothetical protein
MSQFQQPGVGGDKFTAAEHNGCLLLFFPTEFRTQIPTSNGTTDAVATKIVNLNTGQVLHDALVFGSALIPQLKGAVPDGMVLGRLGQGQNTKGNPPWILAPHSEQDVAVAEQWLAANPRNQFQNAAAPPTPPASPAPATGGWGQQAPAPAPQPQATGGWGQAPAAAPQAPAQGGWGAPAPAAPSAPAAPAQTQFPGQWPAQAAPTPPPAPAGPAPDVHPGLVEALRKKGVPPEQLTSMAQAEQIWAVVQHQPDVAA